MKLTLGEVLEIAGGELPAGAALAQDITGVAALADAAPGDLSFFANPKYVAALRRSRASAVLVPAGFQPPPPESGGRPANAPVLIAVENPSLAFARFVARFAPSLAAPAPGVAPTALIGHNVRLGAGVCVQAYAVIEDDVQLGDGVIVGPHAYIGTGTEIGAGSQLYPHVTIRERSRIGARVIIHSGAVIGSDGFGFELQHGRHVKIPQTGHVEIGDDVEIGANSTIDRARFGRTLIGTGTKIDNLVMIAHNVVIGPHCVLVAQTGISGSTRLGSYVTMAGQAGVVGHVEIGDQAVIAAKTGVSKDVPAHAVMFGIPAEPLAEAKQNIANIRRLPKLTERVRKLEAELAALKTQLAAAGPTSIRQTET
jgi:UDP-3-O-[3-hydroxymyristoyl] glucosamine N-acyltransferase